MLAGLAAHGKASGLVGARTQPSLHEPAYRFIFSLDALAHLNTGEISLAGGCGNIQEIEIEDNLGLLDTARNYEISIHRSVVQVDHEVWIDPVIKRARPFAHRAGLRLRSLANDGTRL